VDSLNGEGRRRRRRVAKILQHRHIGTGEQGKGRAHNSHLEGGIIWGAKGIAKGKWHKERPLRLDLLGNFAQQRNGDRRNAGILDSALNQSHGLVTHWSDGGEQHNVDPVGPQLTGNLRSIL
jgi:hypothetical protein